MSLKISLRVLHGQLRSHDGSSAGNEVKIRKLPFLIGSAEDCQMRCPSATIKPHHCSIVQAAGRILVVRKDESADISINDQSVASEKIVHTRDRLKIGGLEFELLFHQVADTDAQSHPQDQVSDLVSDMLTEADEAARAERMADPAMRQFRIDPTKPAAEPAEAPKQPARPQKQPPKKLPPPPQFTAKDTVSAAEQVLKKMLDKKK